MSHKFEDIISIDNILEAWREFIRGKRNRRDVQEFSFCLMDNILALYRDLKQKTYRHGPYHNFNITDPKPRKIHKASVRDRLLHHTIYRKLYPFFDKTFIADSYSCRLNKGTHKAINKFRKYFYIVSKNNTQTCDVLKYDIKKFFASINHRILINILRRHITDRDILWLLKEVIDSFYSIKPGVGLPLGNLTSQLFVNIYMNKFDQFVKQKLKAKFYIRYADDFVILSDNKEWLKEQIELIENFISSHLKLTVHKVSIATIVSGTDFLGWVHFPDHRVLRTATKKRMMKRIKEYPTPETLSSYLGLLGHGNTYRLQQEVYKEYLLSQKEI